MKFAETLLKGCYIIEPNIFEDQRGYFYESFNKREFKRNTGLKIDFVQDNQSKSDKYVLRGLHMQVGDYAQAKLVRVTQGSVLDVCVDLRHGSATYGQHFSVILSNDNHKQLFIPRYFAHGFVVLEDDTIFSYKCDNYYHKSSERGLRYDDPELDIDWGFPTNKLVLSQKDLQLPYLKDFAVS